MTADRIIRWGISATGHIARHFARDIALVPGATLAGVTSRSSEKAKAFADDHPGATDFATLADMANAPSVDAIYIASPNSAHLEQALVCLEAGKPVLIEKPLAASLDEATALSNAARKAGVFAMEAMWSRFLPAMQLARRKIRGGELGTNLRLEAELAWHRPYDEKSRLFDPDAGGGALLDLGVYPVSLARFLLGEPETISGNWTAAPSGVDMRAEITLDHGHARSVITCGFDRDGDNRLVIQGERKTLVLGLPFIGATRMGLYNSPRLAELAFPGGNALPARLARKIAGKLPLPGAVRWHFPFTGHGLQHEIEAACNAIRNGMTEHPDCTLDDSLATLELIGKIRAQPAVNS